MVIETFEYFCLFQFLFPASSYLFPKISFIETVSELKRVLSVGPNKPRLSSSSFMFHHKRIRVAKDPREMNLSWEEQMEFWKSQFQGTKKLLITSANEKQDCKNWGRYFSLTPFEVWYEKIENFLFSHKNYLQKQPLVDVLKVVLKNFSIFTSENLCWSLFLINLQACNFVKKRLQRWCFFLWLLFNHIKNLLNLIAVRATGFKPTTTNIVNEHLAIHQFGQLPSLAKWFSFPLRTKWLWVRIESRCCHLNFKYSACFEESVPWHSGKL